ncbi:MAG TPA: hypothetical protein VLQ89_03455 [Candidatus Binatia bacterium]|nr:hypothetical protein [Candidatus Binatia bacterium]
MKGRYAIFLLLLILELSLFSQYKPWYGHYNFVYGTKAMSMGNAFTAVADDLTAVFWNPAGLAAKRSPEFYFAYQSENQEQEYALQEKAVPGGSAEYQYGFSSKLQQINFFSVSAPAEFWKMKWGFALSYYRYIPYGFKGSAVDTLTYSYSRSLPERRTVNFKGSEGLDVLAFTAAAGITEYFALGCTLQQFFGSGSLPLQTLDANGEFHQQAIESLRGRNFIIGLMFRPWQNLNLGFTWHSGLENNLDSQRLAWEVDARGNKVNLEVENSLARVRIPAQTAFGVSWRPVPWLNLSGDISRIEWQQGTIADYFAPGTVLPYPQKNDVSGAQQQVRNLRLGMEIDIPLRRLLLHLRAGWSDDQQLAVDRSGQGLKTGAYAAGLGCEFSQSLLLEIAYQRQKADWLEDGYFDPGTAVASRLRVDLLKFSQTYRFGRIFKE